jgi:cell wall-associated NlpC family hydrolase
LPVPAANADVGATVLVASAVAPLNAEPRAASEQVSQSLAGHTAEVLEARDGWRRVRLEDGYEGWMHEGYLGAAAPSARDARCSLGCIVRDGARGVERALPFGARISREATIVTGEAVDDAQRRTRFPATGAAIASSAARWFTGASYAWGGITPWGADCSGMVQAAFALHGVPLPRDARVQAEQGKVVMTSRESWRPGDLLFFSERPDGRITHVALVANADTLMHVAIGRGGFAVERLDQPLDAYAVGLIGRLRSARRVLGPGD